MLAALRHTGKVVWKITPSPDLALRQLGITMFICLMVLIIGHIIMGIPFGETVGILAGTQTRPAVLSYVSETTGHELPAMGYISVSPLAMVACFNS